MRAPAAAPRPGCGAVARPGTIDRDPVGDQRRSTRAAQLRRGQPQRAADLGVGQVDRAVGHEAVVEQGVRGDPQTASAPSGQPP